MFTNLKALRYLFIQIKDISDKKKLNTFLQQTAAEGANVAKIIVSLYFHTFTNSIIISSNFQLFSCPGLHFYLDDITEEGIKKKKKRGTEKAIKYSLLLDSP